MLRLSISLLLLFSSVSSLALIHKTPTERFAYTESDVQVLSLYELTPDEFEILGDFIKQTYETVMREFECKVFYTEYYRKPMPDGSMGEKLDGVLILPSWACSGSSVMTPGVQEALREHVKTYTILWKEKTGEGGGIFKIEDAFIHEMPGAASEVTNNTYQDAVTLIPRTIKVRRY